MKKKILIVEDEGIVALDIQTRLEAHGFEVIDIISNGSRAIARAQEEHPDLILMDINLKGALDGVETASLIRREIDCPIIYLTAYADEKTMKKARISDASGYILKPFRESELMVTIELAIQRADLRKKIQENSNWLYSTLNNINDSVITVSNEDRVVFFNNKADELLNHELMRGETFKSENYIYSENGRTRFRNDNREIEIDYSRTEIYEEENKLGSVHFIHDITTQVAYEVGLEKARRAAEDSNRAKNDFLANITHELRTPLNTIMGLNSIISELTKDSEVLEMHNLIGKAADSLLKQVNDLLEFSELDRGEVKIIRSRFSISSLVDEVVSTFREQAELKSINLVAVKENNPFIISDKRKIRDILSSLLSNALKFTKNGSIFIEAHFLDNQLILKIKDTGIGLSAEQKDKIFKLFTQIDGSRKRSYGGIGIGLSLVNKLVQVLDGSLEVESIRSEGSTFIVYLPVDISSDQNSVEVSGKEEETVGNNLKEIHKDLVELYKEVKMKFDDKNFEACSQIIRDFRTTHRITESNYDSQTLFRLSAAVKLESSEKMDKIYRELLLHETSSTGGIL